VNGHHFFTDGTPTTAEYFAQAYVIAADINAVAATSKKRDLS
jgi:hypothetical protein